MVEYVYVSQILRSPPSSGRSAATSHLLAHEANVHPDPIAEAARGSPTGLDLQPEALAVTRQDTVVSKRKRPFRSMAKSATTAVESRGCLDLDTGCGLPSLPLNSLPLTMPKLMRLDRTARSRPQERCGEVACGCERGKAANTASAPTRLLSRRDRQCQAGSGSLTDAW